MTDTTPTATALQSRIQSLSISLLQRFQTLLATAHDESEGPDGPIAGTEAPSMSPEQVASKQLDIEVGTTALIRTAEDLMVLTRGMKELWLFGGLDTVGAAGGEDGKDGEGRREELASGVRGAREGLEAWLYEYSKRELERDVGKNGVDGRGRGEDKDGEAEMNVDG